MQKKARTYTQLEKEKSLEELNRFKKEVTERYATSEFECSQEDVARDNNITRACLRRLMDEAITEGLVSIEIAILVRNKAIQKSKMKVQQAGGRSISHHNNLMKKRAEYLATGISRVETKEIAEDIANDSSKPISYFTRKHGIESDYITKLLLQKAIVENIVSDEYMEKIIARSLKNNSSGYNYFKWIRQEREKNKEKTPNK